MLADTTASMCPVFASVDDVRRDLADTITISLALPQDAVTPAPGQFAMLWLPGVGEVPISYSAIDGRHVEHTIRAVGSVTSSMDKLSPGDLIGLRGPYGRGWQLEELAGRDVVIVAGGLGLAPLRPVVEMAASKELDARSVRLLVGARSPDTLLYGEDLSKRWPGLATSVIVDSAPSSWQGSVGTVTRLLDREVFDVETTSALVCGPEIMMAVVARRLVAAGMRADAVQISLERNMQCAIGHCGHCQLGQLLTCIDGPVVDWAVAAPLLAVRER